jgi:hypothetical protein
VDETIRRELVFVGCYIDHLLDIRFAPRGVHSAFIAASCSRDNEVDMELFRIGPKAPSKQFSLRRYALHAKKPRLSWISFSVLKKLACEKKRRHCEKLRRAKS